MAKGTRVMRDADGNIYDIPFNEVEKALKGGLSLTTQMVDSKGATYDIPEMEVAAAREAGLKPVASQKSPYEMEKAKMQSVMEAKPTTAKVIRGVADVFEPLAIGAEKVVGMVSPTKAEELRAERVRKSEMFDQLPGGGASAARTAGQVGGVVVPAVIAAPATTLRALTAAPALASKSARALYAGMKSFGNRSLDALAGGVAGYFGGKAAAEAEKVKTEVTGQ